jgi:DHA1 family inner membrane transport protein
MSTPETHEVVTPGLSPPRTVGPAAERPTVAALGALGAMAVGAFCYVAMETLPIGLLPLISADLGVSIVDVGLLVTGYGLTVAIMSVPLAYLTRRVPRRYLLAGLLAIFVIATVVSALAGTYLVLLIARVVVALSQAVFWAVVAPAAASLFSVHVRGRVTSTVFAGASLAPMIGVPAGTWLGQQAGWRSTFLVLAAFGLIAFVLLVTLMPTVPVGWGHAASGTHPDLRRYVLLLLTTALAVTGLFAAFTYTAPFLTDVSGFSAIALGPLLLLRGVADFLGTATAGLIVDRNKRLSMVGSVTLVAVALLGLFLLPTSPIATAGFLALTGFSLGALTPALQDRVLEVAPGNSDLASAGNSAAFNVGIAGGAFLGGVALSHTGLRSTALVGGLLVVGALIVVLIEPLVPAARTDREHRHGEP